VSVFLGNKDKIIREKHFSFLKEKRIDSSITMLDAGHNDLIADTALYLEGSPGR
jgi:hypothetical protein